MDGKAARLDPEFEYPISGIEHCYQVGPFVAK